MPDEKYAPVIKWVYEQVARSISDIETIRKHAAKKGLPSGRRQFYTLVRNMVHCGKVEISAYKEENDHYVKGIHQPIVTEALFDVVQNILNGRKRVTETRSTKYENLPL